MPNAPRESILQSFRPSLSYHLSVGSLFCLFLSGRFTQVLLYILPFSCITDENITLTEEQIQAAVAQGQIIDATPEDLIMHVSGDVNQVKLGTVSDVCLSDGDEDNEDDEEEDETEDDFVERNIHGMVSEMSD